MRQILAEKEKPPRKRTNSAWEDSPGSLARQPRLVEGVDQGAHPRCAWPVLT